MAADSTLVNAAFREATSRFGGNVPNLKPLYDSSRAMSKQALDIVTGAMDRFKKQEEILKVGRDKQMGRFKEVMENNYRKLFIQKETMPQEVVNAVDDAVRKLQDEFELVNTYGDNDTVENERARTRLSAQLERVINEAINARATFSTLGDATKNWNDGAVKGDLIAMTRMFDLDNIDKDDNVSVYFNENNKLTFRVQNHLIDGDLQYGDVSYTIDQMRKNIPQANVEADAALLEILNSQAAEGKERATNKQEANFSEEEVKRLVSKQILTKEDFRNVALRRLDDIDEKSFRTHLIENMGIAIDTMDASFQNLFSNLDLEKDGVINELDLKGLSKEDQQLFNANYKKMINVLTDIDDDNFNLDRSKNLFAEYFTSFAEQKYNSAFTANTPTEETSDIQVRPGVRFDKLTVDTKVKELQNVVKNKKGIWIDFNGTEWEYHNGKLRAPTKEGYIEKDPNNLLQVSMPTAYHLYPNAFPEDKATKKEKTLDDIGGYLFDDEIKKSKTKEEMFLNMQEQNKSNVEEHFPYL